MLGTNLTVRASTTRFQHPEEGIDFVVETTDMHTCACLVKSEPKVMQGMCKPKLK